MNLDKILKYIMPRRYYEKWSHNYFRRLYKGYYGWEERTETKPKAVEDTESQTTTDGKEKESTN